MNKRLKILISSNAFWGMSGYSMQLAELLPRIKDEGYLLAASNFFGLQGGKIMVNNILQYPVINHVYGSDALVLHAQDFGADVVFSLQDQWVLHPDDLAKAKHWIPITPIDFDPVPQKILNNLRYAWKIITYSKFGQKELMRNGLYSTYIPHTVDTYIFKPFDKAERKKKSGLPENAFVVGMVAANKDWPPRKSFQEVLDAFKMFLEKVPQALLYIHTNPQFPGGFPIDEYANFIGIGNKVMFPDAYQMNFNTGKMQMALIYNNFDVFVMPSTSEGFGVGLIEAQACGIPVITNNWTSMKELVKPGKTGFLTDISSKKYVQIGSYMATPSVTSIYNSLIDVYKADRVKMGEEARKWMVEEYDSAKVFKEKWIPYLQDIENEIYGKQLDENKQKVDNNTANK